MVRLQRTIGGVEVAVESHSKMHLDEIAGLWLAEKFATAEWVATHCPDGILRLGIGGGTLDEHPSGNGSGKAEDCCATLVAKSLDLDDQSRAALRQLLNFLYNVDVRGNGSAFDLYNTVKALNERYPDDMEHVIAWANDALEAKFHEQLDFVHAVEAVKLAKQVTINLSDGKSLFILVIEQDLQTAMKAALYAFGRDLAAVVQKKTSGHVLVFTNQLAGIRLSEAVRLVRLGELQAKHGRPVPNNLLRQEGTLESVPEWYYNRRGEQLLNGSNTAPGVPPTALPLEEIVDRVRVGIENSLLEGDTQTRQPYRRSSQPRDRRPRQQVDFDLPAANQPS